MSTRSLLSPVRPSARRLVVGMTAAALAAGLSACDIKIGASDDASTGATPVVAVNDGTASVEVGGDGSVSVDDGRGNSVEVGGDGSVTARASNGATAAADQSTAPGAAQGSQNAGGSGVEITNSDWLSALSNVDQTIAPSNGNVVLDNKESFDTIKVDGAATTLTIKGDYVTVVATQADQIVIEGSFANVYVESTKNVTITGDYATIVWAGDTPQINDSGSFNTAGPQN